MQYIGKHMKGHRKLENSEKCTENVKISIENVGMVTKKVKICTANVEMSTEKMK